MNNLIDSLMNRVEYKEGDAVIVHSLGPSHGNKEYRAIVRGLAVDGIARIYILEAIDSLDSSYKFSHYTMPSACMRIASRFAWKHASAYLKSRKD
jgi:hypothetical protein